MEKTYFVYILASARNGTLYIGVTNDLARRI
jgi:putative endonuclease